MVVAPLAVEGDVTVGSNATHDEPNASKGSDLPLVLAAPLVHLPEHPLLQALEACAGLAHPQSEVNATIRPHILHALGAEVVLGLARDAQSPLPADIEADLGAIHQQGLVRVQAEALDVELLDVVVEAIMLLGRDRIELVDLNKGEALQGGPRGLQAEPSGLLLDGQCGPLSQDALDPLDEVLRGLAGGKRAHSLRILLGPLQKSEGRRLAQGREVFHNDRPHFLLGRVLRIVGAGGDQMLLDLRHMRLRLDLGTTTLEGHRVSREGLARSRRVLYRAVVA
mmetsp:Transcript_17994/g.63219  ORF Transcript_17994/g.63219 Transcript_17994/m.63219 type:complete len:281 (+) Transcript_17994:1970-2812(+)